MHDYCILLGIINTVISDTFVTLHSLCCEQDFIPTVLWIIPDWNLGEEAALIHCHAMTRL